MRTRAPVGLDLCLCHLSIEKESATDFGEITDNMDFSQSMTNSCSGTGRPPSGNV